MKLEDIETDWEQDTKINLHDLAIEATRIPFLFAKWQRICNNERRVLRELQAKLKMLRLEKREFYNIGATKEQHDAGWELPAKGRIMVKDELVWWVDADKHVIELTLKVGMQQDKVDTVERIVTSLQGISGFSSRTEQIKAALNFLKWQNPIS